MSPTKQAKPISMRMHCHTVLRTPQGIAEAELQASAVRSDNSENIDINSDIISVRTHALSTELLICERLKVV